MELRDAAELEPDGAVFLDTIARVQIKQRPFDVRWLTTARTDRTVYQQLADLNKFVSLPGVLSIEDPDTASKAVVRGRTLGLGLRRNLNFAAHTRFLNPLVPQNAELPEGVYLDIVLGDPYLNPDAIFHGRLVMPMEALELRSLGIQLHQAEKDGKQATLDTLHLRIAEVRELSIPMAMKTTMIHPAVRRRLIELADPSFGRRQAASPGAR